MPSTYRYLVQLYPQPIQINPWIYEPPDYAPFHILHICSPREIPERRHSTSLAEESKQFNCIHYNAVDDFVTHPIIERYWTSWHTHRSNLFYEQNIYFVTVQEIQAKLKKERDLEVALEVEKQRKIIAEIKRIKIQEGRQLARQRKSEEKAFNIGKRRGFQNKDSNKSSKTNNSNPTTSSDTNSQR